MCLGTLMSGQKYIIAFAQRILAQSYKSHGYMLMIDLQERTEKNIIYDPFRLTGNIQ